MHFDMDGFLAYLNGRDLSKVLGNAKRVFMFLDSKFEEELCEKVASASGLIVAGQGMDFYEMERILRILARSADPNAIIMWAFDPRGGRRLMVMAGW